MKDIEGEVKKSVVKDLATGQCDEWKNVTKVLIMITIMMVCNKMSNILL